MTTPDTERARVTQADRDAATALVDAKKVGYAYNVAPAMREGRMDEHWLVQAFARHREQALASRDEAGGEVKEAAARKAAMFMFDTWGDTEAVVWNGLKPDEKDRSRKAVDAIIRTLSVTYRGEGQADG